MKTKTDTGLIRNYCLNNIGALFDMGYLYKTLFFEIPESNYRKYIVRLSKDGILKQISKGIFLIGESDKSNEERVVEHYLGNVVEDEQIKEICAKIYKKHGAALDLIFANKPDIRNIVSDYIEKWLIDHAEEYDIFVWEKDWSSSFCRFIPNKLRPICEGKSEGWCSYGYLVGFEIYLPAKGAIWLNIVIGPYQDQNYRQKVLDVALKYPEQFNVKKSTLSAKWKRIDNFTVCKKIEDLAVDDDEDSIDFDEKIGKKLKEYFDKLLDKKVECLVNELGDK